MAKRPTQSLDQVGASLLSQQTARRKEKERDQRKGEKWLKALGVIGAGQSLVSGALKRRTQEIKEAGRISKLQSKMQTANFNSLTPIYQAIDEYDDYGQFEEAYNNDPSSFNILKNHVSPYTKTYVKQITGKDLTDEQFQQQYNLLENNIVKEIAKNAFNTKDQFKRGLTSLSSEVGVDKNDMWRWATGLDVNTLDGIKAQVLDKEIRHYGGSIVNRGNMRNLGNTLTFGLVKEAQGQPNLFKDFGEDWRPLSQDIRVAFDSMNINSIIAEQVKSNAPTLKDRVAEATMDKELIDRITKEYKTLFNRINDGSHWWKGDDSPDRYSKFKEDRIDDLIVVLDREDNANIKQRIFINIGALSNRIGDPRETEFKKQFIETYAREFDLEIGSANYSDFVNSLKDVKTRDQLAMNFVLSQVVTDVSGSDWSDTKYISGTEFTFNFDKMDQILRPAFTQQTVTDKTTGIKTKQIVATDVYNAADPTDKQILYRGYVKSILGNYQKTNMNTQQLMAAAKQFMQTQKPPGGQQPQDLINSILLELED